MPYLSTPRLKLDNKYCSIIYTFLNNNKTGLPLIISLAIFMNFFTRLTLLLGYIIGHKPNENRRITTLFIFPRASTLIQLIKTVY